MCFSWSEKALRKEFGMRIVTALKSLALTVSAVIIAGCTTANIDMGEKLKEGEGIMVMRLHTNVDNILMSIRAEKKEKEVNQKASAVIHMRDFGEKKDREDALRVIRLKNGRHCIDGWINTSEWFGEIGPVCFNIEVGKINYVGDFVVLFGTPKYRKRPFKYTIVDNEEKTISEARKRYDWLFKEYPYNKNLGELKSGSVEGVALPEKNVSK
jgi:hypothetical protein